MQMSWPVLLPPLITLTLAVASQRIIPALLSGIITACFLVTNFNPLATLTKTITSIWETSQIGNIPYYDRPHETILLFAFLTMLSIAISLISHSGGAHAFGALLTKHLNSKKDVEKASIFLSLGLFVDDYLSNLTVGNVMRPIASKFNVARVKLAYLVNSLAAPLVLINPVSSWVVPLVAQLDAAGINLEPGAQIYASPFTVYINVIPYIFYSFVLFASVLFVVNKNISFGLMKEHEDRAKKDGNLCGGKPELRTKSELGHIKKESVLDFALPMITLIGGALVGILYTGNFYLFGGTRSFGAAFQNGNIPQSLFIASIVSVLVLCASIIIRKTISIKNMSAAMREGFTSIMPSLTMLCLAWTLSGLLANDLKTGNYIASLLVGAMNMTFLLPLFFVVSLLITIAVGSSWGAMSLMTALAIPMVLSFMQAPEGSLLDQVMLIIPVIGSIFSGAIAGNTIAPIADATIMASNSTGTYHMDHVKTQFAYSIPPLIGTFCGYLILGILKTTSFTHCMIGLSSGILISFIVLMILNTRR